MHHRSEFAAAAVAGNRLEPKRVSMGEEVVARASALAERARALGQRASEKLAPVMSPAPELSPSRPAPGAEYPPLFLELTGSLYAIEQALDHIEQSLSRTEL